MFPVGDITFYTISVQLYLIFNKNPAIMRIDFYILLANKNYIKSNGEMMPYYFTPGVNV